MWNLQIEDAVYSTFFALLLNLTIASRLDITQCLHKGNIFVTFEGYVEGLRLFDEGYLWQRGHYVFPPIV